MTEFLAGARATATRGFGTPLVRGLPSDFVDAVVRGLEEGATQSWLISGTLRVDHAAYDGMESSDQALGEAGRILARHRRPAARRRRRGGGP